MGFYLFFLMIFFIIDSYTVPKILARLIARVKRLELKGFKQKEAKKLTVYRDEKGKIVFIRHDKKKDHTKDGEKVASQADDAAGKKDKKEDVEVEQIVELKKGALNGDYEGKSGKKFADEDNVAEAFLTPGKNGGKSGKKGDKTDSKLIDKSTSKKFKENEDNMAEEVGDKKSKKQNNGPPADDKKTKKDEDDQLGYYNEYGEWIEANEEADAENNYGEEEEQEEPEEDLDAIDAQKRAKDDLIEQQMQKKWEEEKEVIDFVK